MNCQILVRYSPLKIALLSSGFAPVIFSWEYRPVSGRWNTVILDRIQRHRYRRYSPKNISPQHQAPTFPAPTNLPNPASLWKFSQAHQAPRHTRREHTHNTGRKDSHSIMVIIIIMISIRLIYIFIWDDLACFLGLFLYTKRKRFF